MFGRRPVLSIFAIITTIALTAAVLFFYVLYRNVYDSIHHENVAGWMLGKRPPKLNGSLNVLIIGSDSRAGMHGRFGRGILGSRSDTSILLHISPNHQHVALVSFPRDSMVPVLRCANDRQGHAGQTVAPGQLERLNATFAFGGAPCLWKTLEQTTHIHIDHFIEVNFNSFQQIVNDIGGVNVCLPFAVHDRASGLNLSAGAHLVMGAQALAFVRERHVGLGSDLQRIQRQQFFLAAAAQKIKHSGILTDPLKLYGLVHDVAGALTTDISSPTTLLAIANSLKSLSIRALRFITVPVVAYPPDPAAEVQWAPQAGKLFSAIARDSGIPAAARAASRSAKAASARTVRPSQVKLQVLNATNVAGLAAATASKLTGKGFRVTATGNAASPAATSVIEYSSAVQLPEVNTLKTEIAGAQVKQAAGLPAGSLTLILGSSFKGLAGGTHTAKPAKSPTLNLAKSIGGISGNANICKDSGAFAGPDKPSMWANGNGP